MSSPLYVVEVFSKETPYAIVFEVLPHYTQPQIKWGSMFKNERPIRVISINGMPIENGYAIAYVLELDYGGTILTSILYSGNHYEPEDCVDYWFRVASGERPEELVDGSIRVYMNKTSDLGTVFLNPLDTMPFMDAGGIFSYEYTMVSKEVKMSPKPGSIKYQFEHRRCDVPVTLYQSNGKYEAIVDRTTMITHSIDGTVTFREMPIYYEMQ